jgi:hypothetical protein
MARMKTAARPDSWLGSAEELPRETQVVFKNRHRRQKWFRAVIIGSTVLFPFTLLALFVALGNANRSSGSADIKPVDSESRAAATIEVRDWLAQNPSPVPGTGSIVSWNDGTRVQRPQQTADEARANPLPDYNIDVQNFTVVDSNGQTYSVDVQVAVDPKSGSHVIGTPSLTPIPNNPQKQPSGSPWYQLRSIGAPAPVQTAVNAWADAYTSGKSDTLGQAVGDPDGKHAYVALGGVISHKVNIGSAAWMPTAEEKDKSRDGSSDLMVVRVQLAVQYVGQPPLDDTDQKGTLISYDLLVKKANTAAPVVVAWVGPGLGPTAKPYQNALNGRDTTTIIPSAQGN